MLNLMAGSASNHLLFVPLLGITNSLSTFVALSAWEYHASTALCHQLDTDLIRLLYAFTSSRCCIVLHLQN